MQTTMPAPTALTLRHRRVWVAPTLSREDILDCNDAFALDAVLDWVGNGRPLVGRAAMPHEHTGVPLGLASLRDQRRVRIALRVPAHRVSRIEQPLSLAEVEPRLPPGMQPVARRLVHAAAQLGIALRVYGSAFWQHTSGLPYLTPTSDLDLLAQPASAADARCWLDELAAIDADSSVRIDGEVETPGGDAVAWRELARGVHTVLVKSDAGPALRPRASVWAAWEAVPASPDARAALPC